MLKTISIKKMIAVLCMIAVLASFAAPAFAVETDGMITVEGIERITAATQATDIVDTTAMTQSEYVAICRN